MTTWKYFIKGIQIHPVNALYILLDFLFTYSAFKHDEFSIALIGAIVTNGVIFALHFATSVSVGKANTP